MWKVKDQELWVETSVFCFVDEKCEMTCSNVVSASFCILCFHIDYW